MLQNAILENLLENNKEDCFHLGIKALILNPKKEVLLLETRHYWDIPGGRVQKGESQIDTLFREIKEETGLHNFNEIKPFMMTSTDIRIPLHAGDVGLIFSIYLIRIPSLFTPLLSNEHINFEWSPLPLVAEKLKKKYPKVFFEKLVLLESDADEWQ